jgi:hypothetical protein
MKRLGPPVLHDYQGQSIWATTGIAMIRPTGHNARHQENHPMSSESTPRVRLVSAAFVLGISLIFCTIVAGNVVMQTKASDKAIRVKGYAEKRITSDFAIWHGQLTTRAAQLPLAYQQIERDMAKVTAWLKVKGAPAERYSLSSVAIESHLKRDGSGRETSEIESYTLRQSVTVQMPDVAMAESISKEISALIKDGVEFESSNPDYYYTGLEGLKIEMLGEATKDAVRRAGTIIASTGAKLGRLRSAQQGVFQITPVFSTEVSGYGELDSSSIEKTIKAIVDAEFSVE